MADYKKMYFQLFGEVTKAVEILQNAQLQAEEAYISADDTPLSIVDGKELTDTENQDPE